jgi:trehalose 6-phosphate phosphatase
LPPSLYGRKGRAALAARLLDPGGRLLLAFDLDGTLAPIVRRPGGARIPAARLRLLSSAAAARDVRVAVVSARRMSEVRRLAGVGGVRLVAQYGLEGAGLVTAAFRRRARRTAARLLSALRPVVKEAPGAWIEWKGMSLSVHDRGVRPSRLKPLHAALRRFAATARQAGFAVAHGRRVTEFLPRGVDKGRALRALRRLLQPDSVFYFGDSSGDEPAFAALRRGDLGVRVGPGPTKADYRIPGPRDVDRFLRAVLAARAAPARKRR